MARSANAVSLNPLPRNIAMDQLTALGLSAVTARLVRYALEHQNSWFIPAFAGACALGPANSRSAAG
jgi:hypothetical protein